MATEDAAPYLQLWNPKPEAKGEFHLFPQLPTDIRCMIWQQALCHERLVLVDLLPRGANIAEHKPWPYTLHGGGLPIPEDYVIVVLQRPTISKLFHVNAESRSCASRFYRVQLPCTYFYGDHVEENGTLYINPELDTLAIFSLEHFVKFAHKIWVHDPRRVGLLNLAIPGQEFLRTHSCENNDDLREVVSRLRHVWFMFLQEESGKFRRTRFRGTDDTISRLKPHFSRPIMAATPVFDRRPDPRPIQADLRQVYTGLVDPRFWIHGWVRLVAALGVQPDIEYRFMVTYGDERNKISDRDDAARYIQGEYEQWNERLRVPRRKVWQPAWQSITIDETCQDVDQIPRPVMGFWLFPLDCLGPLPSIEDRMVPWGPWIHNEVNANGQPAQPQRYRTKGDFSEYWPELCMSFIP